MSLFFKLINLFRVRVKCQLHVHDIQEVLVFYARAVIKGGKKKWLGSIRKNGRIIPVSHLHRDSWLGNSGSGEKVTELPLEDEFYCSELVEWVLCRGTSPLLIYDEVEGLYSFRASSSDSTDVYNTSVYQSESFELNLEKGFQNGVYETESYMDTST